MFIDKGIINMNVVNEIVRDLFIRLSTHGIDLSDAGLRNSIIMDLHRAYGEGLEQGVIEGRKQAFDILEEKVKQMKIES